MLAALSIWSKSDENTKKILENSENVERIVMTPMPLGRKIFSSFFLFSFSFLFFEIFDRPTGQPGGWLTCQPGGGA